VSLLETYLIDGTDLSNYATGITDFDAAFNTSKRRGSNYVLPGADGETYVAKPLEALPVSIGCIVSAKDPTTGALAATSQLRTAQMIANWRSIVALTKAEAGGTVTLTRKLSTTAGSSTSETCTAECSGGIQVHAEWSEVMRIVIGFVNLSGKWA
jgi:hypothetical protein